MGMVLSDVAITKDTAKHCPQDCFGISENIETNSRDSKDKSVHGKYINYSHPIIIPDSLKRVTPSSYLNSIRR